jgi:rhodanese-related sulfurtransferase
MKRLAVVNLVLVLSLVLALRAFAADDIQTAAYDYFSGGIKNISADVLYENLNDGDDTNDPYIVSVRSQEDYEKGHIPTAVHMNVKTLFTAANLATLPTDQQIVIYCYTGQTSGQVVSALRLLGYDAYGLLYGFGAWNSDPAANSKVFDESKMGFDYAVETGPGVEQTIAYPLPTPLADTIQAAANAYFGGGIKSIAVDALYDNLNDSDASNDPYILSVRASEDYEKGHIPGAINIPPSDLFIEANLSRLPNEQPIVVYCYTDQTAGQVVSALNMLGYDASNMLFGMQAWTMDQDVRVKSYNAEKHTFNYPYEGTAAEAVEEAGGEEEAAETPEPETPEPETPEPETPEPETPEPETMPRTGGSPFPVEGVLVSLGVLIAAAGIHLRQRKAA